MKLTPAQNALLAGLLTLLVTSLSEFLAGIRPFLANGKIDWNGVAIFIVGTALPTLGASIVTYISTHQQQILQAAEDTAQQLHIPMPDINTIHTLLGEIKGLLLSQQTTTPPTINVQVPPAQAPQAPLQGMRQATLRPVVPQPVQQPQQAFPVAPNPTLLNPTPSSMPQTSLAGTSPVSYPSATPAVQTLDITSTDTTPRVAALLANLSQQNQ